MLTSCRVAQALGLDHHELQVRGDALEEVISALVQAHDEPFGDAANIPLYLLARELRGTIKVVLQGDGGDEMFAGYRRYSILQSAALWRLWPHALDAAAAALGLREWAQRRDTPIRPCAWRCCSRLRRCAIRRRRC